MAFRAFIALRLPFFIAGAAAAAFAFAMTSRETSECTESGEDPVLSPKMRVT